MVCTGTLAVSRPASQTYDVAARSRQRQTTEERGVALLQPMDEADVYLSVAPWGVRVSIR